MYIFQQNNHNKTHDGKFEYRVHYVKSEAKITGSFGYEEIIHNVSPVIATTKPPKDNLHEYQVVVKYPRRAKYDASKATKSGYYFLEGLVMEVISLLSVFYGARFHLTHTETIVDNRVYYKIKNKQEMFPTPPYLENLAADKPAFDGLIDFIGFIDLESSVNYQKLIRACSFYRQSFDVAGVDKELSYVRLVSAIEAILGQGGYKDKDIERVIDSLPKSKKQVMKSMYRNYGVRRKFADFVHTNSKGFFKGGNYNAPDLHIKRGQVKRGQVSEYAKRVYDARSNYLHNGDSMYISDVIRKNKNWDLDPSKGMTIGSRKFSAKDKLPTLLFFNKLTRHLILKYSNWLDKA